MQAEGERIVTHLFDCTDPAYAGWRWAVTVVRAPRTKAVTVSETVLLPGHGALLAPDWVPWHERLRPGDLGVGDLLPAPPDDERLVSLVVLEGEDAVTDWFADGADDGDGAPPSPANCPHPAGRACFRPSAGKARPSAGTPASTARGRPSRTRHPPTASAAAFSCR